MMKFKINTLETLLPLTDPSRYRKQLLRTFLFLATGMTFIIGSFIQSIEAVEVGSNEPEFSNARFRSRVAELFPRQANENYTEEVKGYSLVIARHGIIIGEASGGFAVWEDSPVVPLRMTAGVPTNIGSVIKTVTATALLSIFEKDTRRSVDEWLDQRVIDFLPRVWREWVTSNQNSGTNIANVRSITFRQLLQHKSGMRGPDPLIHGVRSEDMERRDYDNSNITLAGYAIPYIVDPAFGRELDREAADAGITGVSGDDRKFIDDRLKLYLERYMQENIFDNIGVRVAPGIEVPHGLWRTRLQPSCDPDVDYPGQPFLSKFPWGRQGDIPLAGDIDGDGASDFVIWRPSSGQWFAKAADGTTIVPGLEWGVEGDIPLVGDVDGDGKDDFVVWRPAEGKWFARAADGSRLVNGLSWGQEGDIPFVGDVNGDGKDDFVVWRPESADWWVRSPDEERLLTAFRWGNPDTHDVPLLGDITGDGRADFVIWRKDTNQWFVKEANDKTVVSGLEWGIAGHDDVPLVGDTDGDGRADFVIWRPTTGEWFARNRNKVIFRNIRWGAASNGDIPLLGDVSADGQSNLLIWRQPDGEWYAAGRRYALSYCSALDHSRGRPADALTGEDKAGCGGAGGYYISPFGFGAFMATFGGSETYISHELRNRLYDPNSSDDRLLWSSSPIRTSNFVRRTFGVNLMPWHNGANYGYRSAFIQLPRGYYGFASINSSNHSTEWLVRTLVRAWTAALGGTPDEGG
jgi:hypothetical protein